MSLQMQTRMSLCWCITGAVRNVMPMRQAKRSVNIPMSQMPTKVSTVKMVGANGRTVFAKLEIYGNKFIRSDLGGHLFKDGGVLPRHFNAGIIDKASNMIQNGLHFWY